jgi:hypothetical protein
MKIKALLGIVAAVALGACQSKTHAEKTASTANDAGGAPMTLVGCLVPGNGVTQNLPVGTSGNTGTAGFTLIDAMNTSAAASGAGTASSASGPPETPGVTGTAGRSYSLVADQGRQDELQKYVNSRVEVIGSAVASPETGAGATDPATPASGAAAAPAGTQGTNAPHVRVQSVRQVATSCNGSKE